MSGRALRSVRRSRWSVKYRLEPGPEARAKYDQATHDLVAALREIRRIGAPTDRSLTSGLLRAHARYLEALEQMFGAVDARDTARVLDIDEHGVDPLFGTIEQRVNATAGIHHAAAQRSLRELRSIDRFVLIATIAAFAVGLLLVAFFALLLARVHRALAAHAEEREHAALHDPLTGVPQLVGIWNVDRRRDLAS